MDKGEGKREKWTDRIALISLYDDWGRADSNRRTPKRGDLQSPAIAAMRHPQMWERECWRKELNPQPSDYKSGALPLSYASEEWNLL